MSDCLFFTDLTENTAKLTEPARNFAAIDVSLWFGEYKRHSCNNMAWVFFYHGKKLIVEKHNDRTVQDKQLEAFILNVQRSEKLSQI
jgi:hypothetical protein